MRFEKDLVVGKMEDAEFRHFGAISEGYNLAGRSKINMCHIDYMDNVGNDPRMQTLMNQVNECDNPGMREALLRLYSNLQEEMLLCYASYDVYVFTSRLPIEQFYPIVQDIIDTMIGGNYLSYSILDLDGVRDICTALYNLQDFSALDACKEVVSGSTYKGIIPISIEHGDGTVEKLGKTVAEKKAEEAELQRQKAERKRKKGKKQPQAEETVKIDSGVNLDDIDW